MKIAILTQEKYYNYAAMLGDLICEEWVVYFDHEKYTSIENMQLFTKKVDLSGFDFAISLLYNKIIKNNEFDSPKYGTINVHPSMLPYHRGSAPNFWAVLCGYGAGWTAHRMTSEIDRGDIYLQREVPVLLSDTAETLWERLFDELPSFLSELAAIVSSGNLTALDVTQDVDTVNKMKDFHDAHEFGNALQEMNDDQRYGAYTVMNLIQACSFTGYEGFIMDTPDGRVEFAARKLND